MQINAFYSDPHFGHAKIIEYCKRPFRTVEEMNRELIHRYNERIGVDDVVIWLGDCFFKGDDQKYANILSEMAGTKILILGNHDRPPADMAALGFALVLEEAVMHIANRACRLSHYPYKSGSAEKPDAHAAKRPRRRGTGEILLHGHSHSKRKVIGDCIDLGVDAWNYEPALYDEVAQLVRGIP